MGHDPTLAIDGTCRHFLIFVAVPFFCLLLRPFIFIACIDLLSLSVCCFFFWKFQNACYHDGRKRSERRRKAAPSGPNARPLRCPIGGKFLKNICKEFDFFKFAFQIPSIPFKAVESIFFDRIKKSVLKSR